MNFKRSERVGDLIRKEVATMILSGDIKDPRIGLVTVTVVRMSPDLKYAKVYFSMLASPEEIAETLEGLQSASGYIRRRLASTLSLKHIPNVTFAFDDSLEYSSHINKVMSEIEIEEDEEDGNDL